MKLKIQRFFINTAYAWNIWRSNTVNYGVLEDRVSLLVLLWLVIFDSFKMGDWVGWPTAGRHIGTDVTCCMSV
jgi:hypothetical protein